MADSNKHKVVVGVDFTGPSDAAIVEALRLVQLGALAELHVVYVVDSGELPDDSERSEMEIISEILDRAPDQMRLKVVDLATSLAVPLHQVKTLVHVRIGDHADAIHQVAVDYDADLIIVGTHNRRLLDRLVLGSVSEKLVREARCPVMVAREKNFEGLAKTPLPDAPYAPGEAPTYTEPHDVPRHMSTQRVEWSGSEHEGPTGVRIV